MDTGTLSLDFYDAEMRRHTAHLRAAARVRPGHRVLDIGCGTGQTTRDAGRAAVNGSVLGVDISEPMLEHARRLTIAEGLRNVTYELGDAQSHHFPPAHFDVCISRFGTMFFDDPVAAFTNVGRALRPGARLAMLVWQDADRNEWFTAPRQAIAGSNPPMSPSDREPFSLGDGAVTRRVLASAGFAEIVLTAVDEPVYYGENRDAAFEAILRLRHISDLLATLDTATCRLALDRLRSSLEANDTGNGVLLDARAWIVTARSLDKLSCQK